MSVADLRRWNSIRGDHIRSGQRLRIQGGTKVVDASAHAAVTLVKADNATPRSHVVGAGDTLSSIAGAHRVAVDDLKRWNDLRGTRILIGQKLRIGDAPVAAKADYADVDRSRRADRPTSHRVSRGDTLGTIAVRYGVGVSDLRRWNGLRSDRIQSGQTLRIAPTEAPSRRDARRVPMT